MSPRCILVNATLVRRLKLLFSIVKCEMELSDNSLISTNVIAQSI